MSRAGTAMGDLLAATVILCLGVQLYHYIAYPLVLMLGSRIFSRPVTIGTQTPSVSLITAAFNEAAIIAEKLSNSLAIDYPDLEIVVVSDGSTDGTGDIAAGFSDQNIVVLELAQRQGKASALNIAAAVAKGEILLISDANAFCTPDLVGTVVRLFADPSVGCVSGRVRPLKIADNDVGRSEGLYWRYESAIKAWESKMATTTATVGSCLAIRRSLYRPIPQDLINDDFFLALTTLRQGYRVIYEPKAVCFRRPSRSMRDERRRRQRIAAGRFQQLSRIDAWPWNQPVAVYFLFSHKFLRLLLPFFMIGSYAANLALLAVPPVPAIFLVTMIGQTAFYGAAVAGFAAEKRGVRWRLLALAYYISASNMSSMHGIVRYLRGKQGVLWQKAAR